MGLQQKGDIAVCSSVGDVEKHEKLKNLTIEQRIEILEEIYEKHGPKSEEFFNIAKPLIMWAAHRHLRGMEFSEDLVNAAYVEIVMKLRGIPVVKNPKKSDVPPKYGTDAFKAKYGNLGKFVLDATGNAVSRIRSATYGRQIKKMDTTGDISDKLGYTDFELDNNLHYYMDDIEESEEPVRYFRFNKQLEDHINMLNATKPRNNILYNFLTWRRRTI